MRLACPVCGDPGAFPFWIDPDPPQGCPLDDDAMAGKARVIRNAGECPYQMQRAAADAHRRKVAPHCYDENGNVRPGMANEALMIGIRTPMTQGA